MESLKSLQSRIKKLRGAVAPRPLKHHGLVVVFRSCDADGKPAPLPDVPHREPEARDPRFGLDVVWLDSDGTELSRCA